MRFARITQELLAAPDPPHTLDRVCQRAVETIAGADFASVSYRQGREVVTPAATDDIARDADQRQYDAGEGPCLSAITDDPVCLCQDTRHDDRWPRWTRLVADLQVGSLLSVRLATPRDGTGALNLYSGRVRGFNQDDMDLAAIYATHAAIVLATVMRIQHISTAMETRHQIGVAQGILMQRYGLTVDQAFDVLLRYSQDTNTKLREVATQLVETGQLSD
jgi:transcriptional regulator with GAF, ATPase, and Fis domain